MHRRASTSGARPWSRGRERVLSHVSVLSLVIPQVALGGLTRGNAFSEHQLPAAASAEPPRAGGTPGLAVIVG